MKVLSEWLKMIKDNEGMLQILGRDPSGNVSVGYLIDNSAEQLTISFPGLYHAFVIL